VTVIYILWLREMRRYVRSRSQILASLAQPLMYLLALGIGLGPVFNAAGKGNYIQFISPGMIAMTILFSSIYSGIGLLWDRQFGFLKETLVAPVPRLQVMIGRISGTATVAVLQGLLVAVLCIMTGFRLKSIATIPIAVLFMVLTACAFSALGTAIGSMLKDMQGFQFIANFLVTPIFFLSGALYPLSNLPKAFSLVTHINPLSYGVDGIRMALVGTSYFGIGNDGLVLAGCSIIFLIISSYVFSRLEA